MVSSNLLIIIRNYISVSTVNFEFLNGSLLYLTPGTELNTYCLHLVTVYQV